jgi:hypothetical protein
MTFQIILSYKSNAIRDRITNGITNGNFENINDNGIDNGKKYL